MCGIFGIAGSSAPVERATFGLPNDTAVLKRRGPDDSGYYISDQAYLAQRRLSIIDLSSGHQPIYNEDHTKCIVFNGEIYNFREIRQTLEAAGHRFATNSDTEAIIHAYEQWGEQCLDALRGMFAFAIWDSVAEELFIARDRLGIKPLFYAYHKGIFYFASEIKAIIDLPFFPREMDPDGFAAYFTLSYIPAPLTIFKHIKKLPAGHKLRFRKGRLDIEKYWDLQFAPDRSKSESYFREGFMALLEEAVRLRLISDVPIGAFLSGGIDSGTVVALMSKASPEPVHTYSMGFGGHTGGFLDERPYARQVVERYGTIHKEYQVEPDVKNIIAQIVAAFDEPFGDDSTIPTYYLSQITRENVKVALSGLGGDELFGGYERYLGFKLSLLYAKFPALVRDKMIRKIVEQLPERKDGHYTVNHMKRFVKSAAWPPDQRYLRFSTILDDESGGSLFAEPQQFIRGFRNCEAMFSSFYHGSNASEPLDRMFFCDFKTYLAEDILALTDRISMWHSLEVRVPFLDHKLVEFCATIPAEMKIKLLNKKHILKHAARDLLPKEVINHRKQGFASPMSQWLQADLKEYTQRVLDRQNLRKHGLFREQAVAQILEEHYTRKEIRDKLIWSLVIFQTWFDQYMS
jgi:asparagine synthase (glutamine-hydrolysing)